MRKIITAKKTFSLEDNESGYTVSIKKGDRGEILGHRPGKGFTLIINDKTLTIKERRILRYFFKVE